MSGQWNIIRLGSSYILARNGEDGVPEVRQELYPSLNSLIQENKKDGSDKDINLEPWTLEIMSEAVMVMKKNQQLQEQLNSMKSVQETQRKVHRRKGRSHLSEKQKELICDYYSREKETAKSTADVFGVSVGTVYRLNKERKNKPAGKADSKNNIQRTPLYQPSRQKKGLSKQSVSQFAKQISAHKTLC